MYKKIRKCIVGIVAMAMVAVPLMGALPAQAADVVEHEVEIQEAITLDVQALTLDPADAPYVMLDDVKVYLVSDLDIAALPAVVAFHDMLANYDVTLSGFLFTWREGFVIIPDVYAEDLMPGDISGTRMYAGNGTWLISQLTRPTDGSVEEGSVLFWFTVDPDFEHEDGSSVLRMTRNIEPGDVYCPECEYPMGDCVCEEVPVYCEYCEYLMDDCVCEDITYCEVCEYPVDDCVCEDVVYCEYCEYPMNDCTCCPEDCRCPECFYCTCVECEVCYYKNCCIYCDCAYCGCDERTIPCPENCNCAQCTEEDCDCEKCECDCDCDEKTTGGNNQNNQNNNQNQGKGTPTAPQTGDTSLPIHLFLMLFGALSTGGLTFANRKKFQ